MKKLLCVVLTAMLPTLLMAGPIDVNSADAETIARELNGVGASRAQAIVDYRNKHGAFQTQEDLLNVTGIGQHIIETNRANIRLGNAD